MTHTKLLHAFALTLMLSARSIVSDAAQEMAGVRQMYDGMMRPDVEVKTFEHSEELFPVRGSGAGKCDAAIAESKDASQKCGLRIGGISQRVRARTTTSLQPLMIFNLNSDRSRSVAACQSEASESPYGVG